MPRSLWDATRAMKRAGSLLAVAAALALLAYRFANPDLASFARDEPQFLAAARDQLRTGEWLSANPLYGNLGLRYGPVSFWFYGAVMALFGDHPATAILAMGLAVTASHLALAFALLRLFEERAVFFAVLVAWLASSPYLFHWSRLAWDLTSHAAVFATVALLATCRELGPGRALALGLTLGLGLATHPSMAPLALAVAGVIGWELRHQPRRLLARAGLMAVAVALVMAPYVAFLLRTPTVRRAARQTVSLPSLAELAVQAPRLVTPWGLGYYFDGTWPDFAAWLGGAAAPVALLSASALAAILAVTTSGIVLALRSSDGRQRRVARAAVLAWAGNVLLLAAVGLEDHPHYHFSSAWVPVFGVAATLAWLRRTRPAAGAAALAALALLALAQFMVVMRWMGYVRDMGGIRGPAYGTALGHEIEAVRGICSRQESMIVVENRTAMYAFPFRYLAGIEPACRDKTLVLCGGGFVRGPRPCPPPMPGAAVVRLGYASDRGGALAVR